MGEFSKAELFFRNIKKLAISNIEMPKTSKRLVSCKHNKSGGQADKEIFSQFIVQLALEMLFRINRIRGI